MKNNIYIVQNDAGLMQFLLENVKGKSRNNIKSMLKRRDISVNGKAVSKFDYPLKGGDKVEVKMKREIIVKSPFEILYEDKDIIVINKPAGLLSIANEKEKEKTAYHMLMEHVRKVNPLNRIFIVHRLDYETSGLMMFAKNEKAKLTMQDNWKDMIISRGYTALVEGRVTEKEGQVHSWLRETKTHKMYSSYTKGDGLEAITNYKLIKAGEKYSLVSVSLETGRKNQIRVHMKDIGHNIAGDKMYEAETNPISRLGLHAHLLEFKHPTTLEVMKFETKIPKEFNRAMNS